MLAVAGGIILAVILLATVDWWLLPLLKLAGWMLVTVAIIVFISFISIIAGG